MTFRVTPCANLEEFGQAVFAIGQYFGMEPTEERMERFSKNLPVERMHAARENGAIVGGAGAFPFELTVPGAVVISGRGASSPEPSFLNRYGGVKTSAFFARYPT